MVWLRRRAADTTTPIAADGDAVATVDDANFLTTTAGGRTLVDFWAPWCRPCRTFAPVLHEAALRSPDGVRFGACNIDENPHTASLLQISSIPTVVVFGPDGREVRRVVGLMNRKSLEHLLSGLRGGVL